MGHEMVSPRTRLLARSRSGLGTKRIIAGVAAAVAAGVVPVANAEIELGEGFSVSGFADMSYTSVNPDGGATTKHFGIDQFETDFMFSGSNGVSAQVDIEYDTGPYTGGDDGSGTSNKTFVEQAFITKKFNDMFSMKFGRFLSYSGWETEEPTGLFQYSGAGTSLVGYGGYASNFYGYYQQGISAYYDGGMFSVMGSIVADAFDPLDRDTDDMGYELGVAVNPIEGLTAKVFYIMNEGADEDDTIINAWVSYAMSGFTFAGEFSTRDFDSGGDATGFLVMGNYATGPWGVTARYNQTKFGGGGPKASAITLAPSYKVGDNLLLVAEYRMDDFEGGDASSIALEALFTF